MSETPFAALRLLPARYRLILTASDKRSHKIHKKKFLTVLKTTVPLQLQYKKALYEGLFLEKSPSKRDFYIRPPTFYIRQPTHHGLRPPRNDRHPNYRRLRPVHRHPYPTHRPTASGSNSLRPTRRPTATASKQPATGSPASSSDGSDSPRNGAETACRKG